MNPLIQENLPRIRQLCRRHGVAELHAFGSVVRRDFGPSSDVDFLVEFDWTDPVGLSDRFLGLKADLESLLGRPVDLVCHSAIRNPVFRAFVEAQKEAIYAA